MSLEFQPGGHSILQDQGRGKIVCENRLRIGSVYLADSVSGIPRTLSRYVPSTTKKSPN
jgi:hypothetical protein